MSFTLFLGEDGKPQFNDKNVPLFMQPGATEPVAIDINVLMDEAKRHSSSSKAKDKELADLKQQFQPFNGLDPEAARKAMETVKLLDEGKLIEAGKVDDVRQKAVAEFQQKLASMEKALGEEKANGTKAVQEKEQMIHNLLVKNAFSESSFLREKTVLPPDFAYANFSKHFSVEYHDGVPVVVAKDGTGNILFSQSNPGQNASPEEAIRFLIEQHPQRDSLLKAPPPNGGSGAHSGSGRSLPGGAKSLAECKTEAEKVAYLKAKTTQ